VDRLSKLVGARRTIFADGREYKASPITVRQQAEFKHWLAAYIADEYDRTRALLEPRATPEQLAALREEAVAAIRDPLRSSFAGDPVPTLEYLRLAFEANHPGITREEIDRVFASAEQREALHRMVTAMNDLERSVRVRLRAEGRLRGEAGEGAGDATDRDEFWHRLFRLLAETFGWTFDQIADMPLVSVLYAACKNDPADMEFTPEGAAALAQADREEPE